MPVRVTLSNVRWYVEGERVTEQPTDPDIPQGIPVPPPTQDEPVEPNRDEEDDEDTEVEEGSE